MAVQIILKNSSVEDKRPTANQLANGELSLNYHEDGAFLCCRDTDGNIQQVGGIKVSEDAPGTPVLGSLWFQASTQSLFVHNGTSWLEAASGGGGGGGGTAGVTRLIAADGIDALPASGTGVVTINADLDTERGLEFVAGEIAVNLGIGLEFNAVTGAIDATASALQYRGTVDLTSGAVPAGPVLGDTYVNTGDGAFDAAWVTATGESAGTDADPGDLVVWNGTVFTFVPTGGGGGGGVTDLSYTPTEGGTASQGGTVVSSTGTNADIPMVGYSKVGVLGDAAQAGLMSPADKDKLDGINVDADGNVTNIAQQQADWDEVDTAEPTFIQNKPTISVNGDGDITNVRVDLGYTAAVDGGTVTNDSGDDASIPFATAANAGLFLEPGTPAATTQFARQVTDAGAASWVAVTGGGGASVTVGPAADRPLSPSDGELFHNTDNDTLWVWVDDQGTWAPAVPLVPAGGGSDYTTAVAGERCFFNNEQQIDEDYTVTSTTNSLSAGPITVDASATVTVESGGTWTVVGSQDGVDPAGFWSRTGTTLSPANAGDDLDDIGNIEVGNWNGLGDGLGMLIASSGQINLNRSSDSSALALQVAQIGSSSPTLKLMANGSITAAGGNIELGSPGFGLFKRDYGSGDNTFQINNGNFLQCNGSDNNQKFTVNEDGTATVYGDDATSAFTAYNNGSNTSWWRCNGKAYFQSVDGTRINIVLDPDNPDSWKVTQEEYQENVTGPLGKVEKTVTKTREVSEYVGPVLSVRDELQALRARATQQDAVIAQMVTALRSQGVQIDTADLTQEAN